MAEKKQLTVAELLARNAKERGTDNKPRRRRRRSLEDGGVSVAELTGNLPKVDAKPPESKHSNVDIDDTASVVPAPAAADAAADAAAKEKEAAADSANADSVNAESAKLAAETRRAEEIKRAEFARKAAAAKAAAKAAADKAAAAKAAADKAAADKAVADKAAAEVQEEPGSPSLEQTAIIDKVEDSPEDSGDTGVIPVVEKPAAEESEEVEELDLGLIEEEEDEEDAKPNPVAIVLLVLVGIVLGAVIFKGFEVLWGSMNNLVVGILAVAVCGIIGGIVHALRTERDRLSVGLSVVTGLLLTFGPLLLV